MNWVGVQKRKVLADNITTQVLIIKYIQQIPLQPRYTIQAVPTHWQMEQEEGKSGTEDREDPTEASWILIGCLFFISPRRDNIYEFDLSALLQSNKTVR